MIIWDLPLRLFHWSLMICVFGAIATGKAQLWDIHERFGLAIMALVTFRILWGFIGSQTARFSTFLTGPKQVWQSFISLVKKQTSDRAGHSPLGGYATIALLLIPLFMAVTGSFSTDDILFDGPFYHVMPQWAQQAGQLHHFGEKLVFLIILLHVGALSYYWFGLRKNLIRPMIKGKGQATGPSGALSVKRTIMGLVLLVLFNLIAQYATTLRPDYF